jgi:uncharacterized protein
LGWWLSSSLLFSFAGGLGVWLFVGLFGGWQSRGGASSGGGGGWSSSGGGWSSGGGGFSSGGGGDFGGGGASGDW